MYTMLKCVIKSDFLFSDQPPYMFTQQPQGGSPEVQGNTKVLLCAANGLPRPRYSWTMNEQALTEYTNISETSLKIQNIQRGDAGEYQCTASNPHGAVLSNRVQVHVACEYLEMMIIYCIYIAYIF